MRLGVFAKTFPGSEPLTVLRAARAAGFEAVQWNMACSGLPSLPAAIPEEACEALRAASEATGVTVAAVSATYNMIHPDPGARAAGREAFAAIAGAARAMGTDLVTLCTGSLDPQDQWRHHPGNASPEAWAAMLAEMRLLLPLAERHGLRLGVEPETANVVASAAGARRLLEEADHPAIGIILDPANLFDDAAGFRDGAVVAEAVDLLGPHLVMAHAKDRDAEGRAVAAGRGLVDFAAFAKALARAGFDDPLVAHGMDAAEAPAVARHLRAALA